VSRAAWLVAGGVALLAAVSPEAVSSSAGALSGAQLGFVRAHSIFLASHDGTRQRAVLRGKGDVSYLDPAWSRNGRLAATEVSAPEDRTGSDRVIVIRPGRAPLHVPGGYSPSDGAPTWAPDNKRIALIGYNYGSPRGGFLYRSSAGTSGGSHLIDGVSPEDDLDDQPAWSRDGHAIAFARYLDGGFRLFSIAPDASNRRQLTQGAAHNPSWSPDSRKIAFDDGLDIYVINQDGSGLRRLTSANANDSDPAWAPDGREIAFVRGKSIWLMHPDGMRPRRVIRNGLQPAWKDP
jgi:Tol biopolymer transport system component